jgi:hypothetical protein
VCLHLISYRELTLLVASPATTLSEVCWYCRSGLLPTSISKRCFALCKYDKSAFPSPFCFNNALLLHFGPLLFPLHFECLLPQTMGFLLALSNTLSQHECAASMEVRKIGAMGGYTRFLWVMPLEACSRLHCTWGAVF